MTKTSVDESPKCTKCKKFPAAVGRKSCISCLAKWRLRKATLKATGKCANCGDGVAAVAGQLLCVPCGYKARRKSIKAKQQAIRKGICTNCQKRPRLGSYRRCEECIEKEREQREKDSYGHKCMNCHKRLKAYGYSHCQRCIDKRRADKTARKLAGICGRSSGCTNKTEDGYAYCAFHRESERVKTTARRIAQRQLVIDMYGGCCVCCKETEFRFLAIDHVNGGGQKEGAWGPFLIRRIISEGFPERFQILCHNCNIAKGHYGICPHQEKKVEIAA